MSRTVAFALLALLAAAAATEARVMLQDASTEGAMTEGGSTEGAATESTGTMTEGGMTEGGMAEGGASTEGASDISLAQAVELAPQYNLSTLIAAVSAANLTAPLMDASTTWTIFAPTDEAFTNLISDLGTTAEELLADTSLLTKVLSLHVVPGTAATADTLSDGQQLTTLLEGSSVTVSKPSETPGSVSVFNAACATPCPPAANVVVPDVKAGQSVIHVIDRVLLP
ncbi:MAG: Fasciclin domain-containing protein [Monoraphidium minutum]|nr:MAG: Fasciclin domain-containing protein [Monoraphidium minutum]